MQTPKKGGQPQPCDTQPWRANANPSVEQRLLPSRWWRQSISNIASLAPIHAFHHPVLDASGLHVDIKREDLLCPFLGGNKLYKLHFHLQRALAQRAHTLATFGGAYSNHIYALARVGYELGIKTVGIIRGERPPVLSPTLDDAQALGMQLRFVAREAYRDKQSMAARVQWGLTIRGVYTIPEGGGDMRGALGMAEYWRCVQLTEPSYDAVVIAAGTGASLAGIMAASHSPCSAHGILMLKGSAALNQRFCRHVLAMAHALRRHFAPDTLPNDTLDGCTLPPMGWQLHTHLHQGGYGPAKGEAAREIAELSLYTGVPLDPVYTGKMVAGVLALAQQGTWQRGQRLLLIHSGGLQGGRCLAAQNEPH
ncbi:MAG TPA: pyridoxal-phosphate dependent enzyme [Marinagarivorans sp.]